MRVPTESEMKAYFQGYEQCRLAAQDGIEEARRKKEGVAESVMHAMRKAMTESQLQAETKGYRTMPDIGEIKHACTVSGAFMAGFAVAVFFLGLAL